MFLTDQLDSSAMKASSSFALEGNFGARSSFNLRVQKKYASLLLPVANECRAS